MKYLWIVICCIQVVALKPATVYGTNEAEDSITNISVRSSDQLLIGTDKMSVSDQFNFLHKLLKEIYQDYSSDVWETLAFLIITLGWFITSNKSREFFKSNQVLRISTIFIAVALCAIHVQACILTYFSSQKIGSMLDGLNFLGPGFYSRYLIDFSQLTSNLVQNIALFSLIIVIVWSLKRKPGS